MKKKYAVIHDINIVDNLVDTAKIYERLGTQLKYRVFELGQEYEVETKSIVRHFSPKKS